MKKITFHTNDFYGECKLKGIVRQMLDEGCAVRISANCIGHTRAAMIQYHAEQFFAEEGAVVVERDEFGDYYAKVN